MGNKSSMPHLRDNSLDVVGGMLIIYMIVYHAFALAEAYDDTFYIMTNHIFYFFMPWFFFKSGMFYRKKELRTVAMRDGRKLLTPFFVYTIIGTIIMAYGEIIQGNFSFNIFFIDTIKYAGMSGSFRGNQPLWFLLTLYLVKIVVALADTIGFDKKYRLALAFLISGGGNLLIEEYSLRIPNTLLNVWEGLLFYELGYFLREKQYEKSWLKVLAIILYILSITFLPSIVDMRSDNTLEGYWFTYILFSLAGIILANNIFRFKILQLHLLTRIGRNSMDYYCAHWIVFSIVILFYHEQQLGLPDYELFWQMILAAIIVLPLYSNILENICLLRTTKK